MGSSKSGRVRTRVSSGANPTSKPRSTRRVSAQSRGRAASAKRTANAKRSTNAELDALYDTFLQQPAQLSLEQMNMIERRLCTGDMQWRQLALASLTKSGTELKERFGATREAAELAAELLTVAEDMGQRLHQLATMLETASTRLMLSLCERPDMHEIVATARARMRQGAVLPGAAAQPSEAGTEA